MMLCVGLTGVSVACVSDPALAPLWPPVYVSGGGSKNNHKTPKNQKPLDPEAINFIHRIYCRECQRMEEDKRREKQGEADGTAIPGAIPSSEGGDGSSSPATSSTSSPTSPMMTSVEEQSLQQTMDKNKECECEALWDTIPIMHLVTCIIAH